MTYVPCTTPSHHIHTEESEERVFDLLVVLSAMLERKVMCITIKNKDESIYMQVQV